MKCPKCHGKSGVIDTRCHAKGPMLYRGLIYRRHKCDECGHRWSTYEMTAARLELLFAAERAMVAVRAFLDTSVVTADDYAEMTDVS